MILGMQKVLLIEHDLDLQAQIRSMLESEYFLPVVAGSIKDASANGALWDAELMLWDVDAPELFPKTAWQKLTGTRTAAIVLSAQGVESNVVRWLDAGADDYVKKPFSMRELLARIRAILRREQADEQDVRRFSDITVDLRRRMVFKLANQLALTKVEFNLLACFLENPDRVLSRALLLNVVWGYFDGLRTRTVDNHVGRLRRKLEQDAANPKHFLTEHSVGYRFLP